MLGSGAMKPRLSRRRFIGSTAVALTSAPFIARGASREGFEIGLVADAQFADVEAKGTRFYRSSLARLEEAVEHGNGRDLAFCVHLGDLIDRDWSSFDVITRPLARSRHRWHQVLGNHDFDVADERKAAVPPRLAIPARRAAFDHGDFRFVILDTNDVSTYAHPAGSPNRAEAERELARLVAAGVRQAKPWNGGLGSEQRAWFDRTCAEARTAGRRVVVFAHHPVYPENEHNVWNADEVLAVLDRHPHVVAWFNGHNHAGAFGVRSGVPFVTLRGMVETRDTSAFAVARVMGDRIVLTGHGREPSRELMFRG